MARKTRYHAQNSDLPPPSIDPIQEQGVQPDLNDHNAEEVLEHRPRKEPMITEADNDTNLGELTRYNERLEDVIGATQTTVNQLNQCLIQATGQGIQLLPNLVGPTQQGGNKRPHEQADESQTELARWRPHPHERSCFPPWRIGDIQ